MPKALSPTAPPAEAFGPDATFPPLTVSRPDYLKGGSDAWFRQVIYRLIQSAEALERCRTAFGQRIGLTGNQYLVLMGAAYLGRTEGVGIGALAAHIGLAAPHVTTEAGRLARRGLLTKRPNPEDRRGVLVALSPEGKAAVAEVITLVRPVNDILFDGISPADLAAALAVAARLAANSEAALARLRQTE